VEGFDADAQVALRLGDRPVGVVTTDAEGALRTRRPAAGLPCGDVPVVAEQMAYDDEPPTATSTLTVHCARVAPATLTVDPGVVSRGGAVRALGAKFTPGTKVRLSWLLVGGRTSPQVAEVTVRADGTFATGVLVLTHDEQGTRDLVAVEVVAAGPPPSAATDSVLVVGGSMQPGRRGLVSRR
jgi:hypothetical protein